MIGWSHPRLSFLSSRRAIRRLRRSICFRILVFTRKPPCFGIGDVVATPSIRPKTPKVFEFFHQTTQANPSGFAWLRASRGLLLTTAYVNAPPRPSHRSVIAFWPIRARVRVCSYSRSCRTGKRYRTVPAGWKPQKRFRVVQQVELVKKPYQVSEHRACLYKNRRTGQVLMAGRERLPTSRCPRKNAPPGASDQPTASGVAAERVYCHLVPRVDDCDRPYFDAVDRGRNSAAGADQHSPADAVLPALERPREFDDATQELATSEAQPPTECDGPDLGGGGWRTA